MKWRLKILASFTLIVLVSLFIVVNGDRFSNSAACGRLDEFKKEEYSGIVLRKYIDEKNHQFRTVNLKHGKTIVFVKDTLFYDFVKPNDLIVKGKSSDYLIVYRGALVKQFKIDYGCDDK